MYPADDTSIRLNLVKRQLHVVRERMTEQLQRARDARASAEHALQEARRVREQAQGAAPAAGDAASA